MNMRKLINTLLFGITLLSTAHLRGQDYLQECWNKQVKPLQTKYITFSYQENLNKLQHSFEPWQETNYIGKGIVWSGNGIFLKQDTLIRGKRKYYSKSRLTNSELVFLDYGDDELFSVTKEMFLNQTFETARYIPTNLIDYFLQNKVKIDKKSYKDFALYKTTIHKTIVTLFISKTNHLLQKVTMLSDDELFGDVTSTFEYSNYEKKNNLNIPKKIRIGKINGKVKDAVSITDIQFTKKAPQLLALPIDYKLAESKEIKPEISITKYSSNIHFIELKHTDDKIMIVEFQDFLLVAEAPINSKNGELIVSEAKKIAQNKPIKYFVFGHYHPHYLGGIRAFVHQGAKIICSSGDEEYVKYIVNAPHILNPDHLQKEPKPLQLENIKDSLLVSDGKFEMKIYFIGEKSQHTKDYLIYYFPSEKLLFQDDLVWIKREGEIKKAERRQAGLYNAIKELGLDVETIIQSWPVADHGVKTVIPFRDLEKSLQVE